MECRKRFVTVWGGREGGAEVAGGREDESGGCQGGGGGVGEGGGGGTNDRFICMYQQLRRSRRACSCFLTGARIILHHHIPGATQQVQLRWTLHNFFNLSDYFMDTRPRLKD